MLSVCVVDDDSDDLLFVKNAFERYNNRLNLLTFTNGKELLKHLYTPADLPAFILMDMNMPIMAGIETLKVIRETNRLSHLNVIIFSTSNSPDERQASIEAGANEYICKPASTAAYDSIAEELLRKWAQSLETTT